MVAMRYAIIADRRSAVRYVLDPARIAEVLARAARRHPPAQQTQAQLDLGRDHLFDALRDAPVGDVFRPCSSVVVVGEATPLEDFLPSALRSEQVTLPVVNDNGSFVGMVALDLVCEFYDETIARLAIAADCAAPFAWVTPNESLATALERLDACQCAELPVMAGDFSRSIIGFLSYEIALRSYIRRLSHDVEPPPS